MPIDKLSANAFATGAVSNSLGYTPANKAGDTFTGNVVFSANATVTGAATFSNTVAIGGEYISPYIGFKNRIINGAMVIDQRNAGASVTTSGAGYTLDRWSFYVAQASKLTIQQSSTAPTGFVNSSLVTSSSAYYVVASDQFEFRQFVEGFNTSDFSFGTASATYITLSFWVRSSLTGTFGGAIRNSANDRSYVFSYSISSANTYEYKTITIAGDTSGTWLTTNGKGIGVFFSLGAGSTFLKTAGSWGAGEFSGATGQTNLVGTNGATFYIAGVQLEKGSTATAFDYRSYGHELQLCQRYYEHTYDIGVAAGTATENGWDWIGSDIPSATTTGTLQSQGLRFETRKRTQPSMTVRDATGAVGKATRYYVGSGPSNNHTCTTDLITTNSFRVFIAGTSTTTNGAFHWAANAEL